MTRSIRTLALLGLAALLADSTLAADPAPVKISFKKTQLFNKFISEGAAVGDFNHDGELDISAGQAYFAAPDWLMQPLVAEVKEIDPHGYSNSFMNFADDVNGDGWTDLLVVDFPGAQTWYLENPRGATGPWPRHVAVAVTNNESPTYLDVDGDGKRELILGTAPDPKDFDGPARYMALGRPGADVTQPWTLQAISSLAPPGTQRFSHGLGVGDINGDGRNDVLVPQGWWEAPSESTVSEWTFHAAPLGENCAHMHVYDFDGDGDNDVLSSSAHGYGIWWHEQTPDGWQTHEITKDFSQTHALCFADINGDGLPDFVTGKRWWAHGPSGDPGSDQPAVMCWFELTRQDGKPVWTPHPFDDNSGIGTQFEVADVNADGLWDVVTSNKQGVFYFEQVRE